MENVVYIGGRMPKIKPVKAWAVVCAGKYISASIAYKRRAVAELYKAPCCKIIPVLITPIEKGKKRGKA